MPGENSLSRPLFFDRQNLRAEDLNALVDWIQQSDRRFNRHVIGWGVTCGLAVERVAGNPWMVRVSHGFAISPSGAQIAVPHGAAPFDVCPEARACLNIPGPCANPGDLDAAPAAPAPGRVDFTDGSQPAVDRNPRDVGWAQIRTTVRTEESRTRIIEIDPFSALLLGDRALISLTQPLNEVSLTLSTDGTAPLVVALDAAGNEVDRQMHTAGRLGVQTLTLSGPNISSIRVAADGQVLFLLDLDAPDDPVGEVYLAVCPDERLECPRPAVPHACEQPDSGARFSRACETYRFRIMCNLPEGHAVPDCDEIADWVCEDRHLPCPPDGPDCLVIATLHIGRGGILEIDEFTHRRRLLPQWLQAERARCRCDLPTLPPVTPPPTQFTRFTTFTPFTDFSEFSRFTFFSRFSEFTFFSEFTNISRFSVFTDISRFSVFTEPVFTRFVDPGGPIGPIDPIDPVGPIGPVFDEVVRFDRATGRTLAVTELAGVGRARGRRLTEIGITNITEFIERGSEELSETLGMSEVRVAELQAEARRLTLERRG